jgi:hypothetical protein
LIDIRNIYSQTFKAIKNDTKLLDLLDVEYKNVDNNKFLTNLRAQVIEGSAPDDLLNNYKTRLCIHERTGSSMGLYEELGYLVVDIHITKDRNSQTGVLSDIVKRLVEVLDTAQRKKRGLPKLNIGLYGLKYNTRTFEDRSQNTGWEKYSVVFEYKSIL